MKIGLFYGSTTCYTEMVAEKIQALIGADVVDLHNIKTVPLTRMADYQLLILGLSTWDFGEIQEDWEARWDDISNVDLTGKTVAIYGMGDQLGYAEWFIDAVGMLHEAIAPKQPDRIGFWPAAGYDFIASKALTADGGFFYGLALDDENQYEQTDERLNLWVSQILTEIAERL
ncbi:MULTISPECIES: flavodoxin FldB [unclassified Arsukibacterium]|uniref:flavodoxin FldB n=1 Tax=unclassified Arsukibacterium TaxID=2635278 RepID=UPI000C5148EF|nr:MULTISPECIES: flavodoxin FldB [unclassified Arsukibacterium]MAA93821.1 flavodoxin FldB [Rheinheimera sp.]MBM34375.1 flavodoxin FldB [Rheinheimera sp.]|tara:strand:- start:22435 stop:22953 length:519 start_codon:yes stop_codon:yes gene_type:complete